MVSQKYLESVFWIRMSFLLIRIRIQPKISMRIQIPDLDPAPMKMQVIF
jgi:hypothetical protein